MTSQIKEHVTSEMCSVLQYTAEHGCMAKIGEPWLGPARLLETDGLIVLWRCLDGHFAARLTPAGAEVLSLWRACEEGFGWGAPRFHCVNPTPAITQCLAISLDGCLGVTDP
jgi:hypothetical protein